MKNTKLIHIFKQLSEEEFKKLGKFAHSPYFNSNKALPKLYEFFAPFYPDFDSKKMNHEDAFNFIYEKKGANISKKIVDLMSDMYKLVAKYIQQLEYEKDEIGKQKYMAEAWADKKYFHLFEKELDNLKEKIEKAPYRDLQYYYNRYDIENRKYLRASVGQIEYSKDSLETMKESLGGVFDFGQLKVNLEMHSRKNLLGESFESLDSLEKIEMVNENSVFQEILIQKIYANLLKVVVENKEESFIQAKDLFFENYEDLSQNNQKDILGYLVNFTTIQWNKGNTKYTPDGFELLKFGFENGLFLNVPNIESLFINIVLKGVFLKRGKWLESFISKNNQYLREDSKESVVIFCKSFIAYSQQQFSEARNLLMSYRFVRQQDKLRAKSLLIRAIYEDFINDESQYSLLSANIAAFQKYIKRNRKLSRHREISYLNFLKILNQIAKYRYFRKNNYYTLKRNFDEFKDIKFITNKNWLEDKILELK